MMAKTSLLSLVIKGDDQNIIEVYESKALSGDHINVGGLLASIVYNYTDESLLRKTKGKKTLILEYLF